MAASVTPIVDFGPIGEASVGIIMLLTHIYQGMLWLMVLWMVMVLALIVI